MRASPRAPRQVRLRAAGDGCVHSTLRRSRERPGRAILGDKGGDAPGGEGAHPAGRGRWAADTLVPSAPCRPAGAKPLTRAFSAAAGALVGGHGGVIGGPEGLRQRGLAPGGRGGVCSQGPPQERRDGLAGSGAADGVPGGTSAPTPLRHWQPRTPTGGTASPERSVPRLCSPHTPEHRLG